MNKTFSGTIEEARFAPGSKSDHMTLVLKVDEDTQYKLRLRGANAFDSSAFEPFRGQHVTINGRERSGQLMIDNINDVQLTQTPPPPPAPRP